jgi:Na+/phosphate symporter
MKASADSSRRRAALAISGLVFGVCAPVVYVLQRLYEAARDGGVDPASILRQVHATYYYRALIAAWFAALIAALVYRAARSREADLDAHARSVARLALIALPLCAALAWLVP